MGNPSLDESQAGIKIARRNINNLIYAENTTLMVESKEELKMTVKEASGKADLKLSIQKTKITASSPITSCQIDGGNWKLSDFIFLASKITAVTEAMKMNDHCFLKEKL